MIVNLDIQSSDVVGRSYNSSISTSYTPINNQSASVTTISGDTATGLFASEMCTLQSATSDATFPYPASSM